MACSCMGLIAVHCWQCRGAHRDGADVALGCTMSRCAVLGRFWCCESWQVRPSDHAAGLGRSRAGNSGRGLHINNEGAGRFPRGVHDDRQGYCLHPFASQLAIRKIIHQVLL